MDRTITAHPLAEHGGNVADMAPLAPCSAATQEPRVGARIKALGDVPESRAGRIAMNNVYALSEVVGTSDKSIEDAIDQAINVAGQSIRNLDWFQVSEMRGHIKDGRVAHYQVALKLGFRYEAKQA
jgi:flavin-binding protein dodecin